jgi:protein-S-isoprenylcysteine O-methyltransferase Ste14
MRPLIFVLPHALVFWIVFFWTFAPEFMIFQSARKESRKEGSKDAGSIKVIMATMQLGMILAFPAAWLRQTMMPPGSRIFVFYAAVVLLILGSLLRRLCWKTLGEYFTGDVKAREGQPVIKIGPYRWVRHPSYTAGIMMNVAIGLALTNWLSVGILFLASIAGYAYRVHVEERALVLELGPPYAEYMRTHKRFVPFII